MEIGSLITRILRFEVLCRISKIKVPGNFCELEGSHIPLKDGIGHHFVMDGLISSKPACALLVIRNTIYPHR